MGAEDLGPTPKSAPVIHVIIHIIIILHDFHKRRKEVCLKTRSISASRLFRDEGTKLITVEWSSLLYSDFAKRNVTELINAAFY